MTVFTAAIPFAYLFATRLRSLQDRVSWVIVHPMAVLMVIALADARTEASATRLVVALALFAFWQSLYEIGYIENDSWTTQSETAPTRRLSEKSAWALRKYFAAVVAARAVMAIGFFCFAWMLARATGLEVNFGFLFFFVALAATAFFAHNRIRSRWNVVTFCILSACKYCVIPISLLPADVRIDAAFACLLVMPLPRSLEHACKPKYGFELLRGVVVPFVRFRAAYYLVMLLAGIIGWYFLGWHLVISWMAGMFLVYRGALFILVTSGHVVPTVHPAYEKDAVNHKGEG